MLQAFANAGNVGKARENRASVLPLIILQTVSYNSMMIRLRKLIFTGHISFSLGWLGAVVAYIALAIAGLGNSDALVVRSSYIMMELIGWYVIVPFCIAGLLSGLLLSLGTKWGLFRYYWILSKFLLTMIGTVILLVHMRTVSRMSGIAAAGMLPGSDFMPLRVQLLVHAAGGLLILLTATVLSVYKPWGMTPYGKRRRREYAQSGPGPDATVQTLQLSGPQRRNYALYAVIGLVLLFIVIHLAGRMKGH